MADAIAIPSLILQVVQTPRISADAGLALWGGDLAVDGLPDFLTLWWAVGFEHGLWQQVHRLDFAEPLADPAGAIEIPPFVDLALLERVRLFGASDPPDDQPLPATGGDLELRRDGDRLLWRFVGRAPQGLANRLADARYLLLDYWQEHSRADALVPNSEQAMLWGERHALDQPWRDDRVGWADLDYPLPDTIGRVKLDYLTFSERGQVGFVWWLGLSGAADDE